jgi:hypothetical protein
MPCQSYPSYSKQACTFEELLQTYSYDWLELARETIYDKSFDWAAFAGHLLHLAHTIVADYPGVDLWDCIEPALRHTMTWYESKKGPFDKLFERNFREQVRKTAARDAQTTARTRRREGHAVFMHTEIRRRNAPVNEVAAAYKRWSMYLLDAVTERFDQQTRTYVEMRRDGASVKKIAEALGLAEKTVWNKFGGEKLAHTVQQEVRCLVLGLPDEHRKMLARHLLEEAELTTTQVKRLLGVALLPDPSVRLVEEEPLLTTLGWASGKIQGCREEDTQVGSMYCDSHPCDTHNYRIRSSAAA